MSISVSCDGCGKNLSVKDEHIGKMLKCPDCGVKFLAEPPDPNANRHQAILDRIFAQWPLAAGIVLIVLGLFMLVATAAVPGLMMKKVSFSIVGLGLGSIGYWALSSNNRDYNF